MVQFPPPTHTQNWLNLVTLFAGGRSKIGAFRRTEVSEIEIPQPIHHRDTTPARNSLSRQLQRAAAGWVGWNCWFHLRGILCSSWLHIIHVVPAWYSWQIAVISSLYDKSHRNPCCIFVWTPPFSCMKEWVAAACRHFASTQSNIDPQIFQSAPFNHQWEINAAVSQY